MEHSAAVAEPATCPPEAAPPAYLEARTTPEPGTPDRKRPASRPAVGIRVPLLVAAEGVKRLGLHSAFAFEAFGSHPSSLAERLSPAAAARAARGAYRQVPAYRDFIDASGCRPGRAWPAFTDLPETDKPGYVDAYPLAARCAGGAVPTRGVELDESSGSSGRPYTWVRGEQELRQVRRTLSQLARVLVGPDLVSLNGFSMGAWATGTNVAAALAANGVLKSPGPDIDKMLSAFELLGPGRTYLVAGYPPFLKHLLDAGEQAGVNWSRYRMVGVTGGEGMSEAQRSYLERHFARVYSAYGASDLDIGLAAEMPLSIWIRRRAAENPALARALFGTGERLPMLFQYNPLDYHVETNPAGELVVTVTRRCMLSPRIRYNVHDAGGALGFREAIACCRDFGLDPLAAVRGEGPTFRLPFLFVRGRSDSTLSYMGANIYPEDVEAALFAGTDARRLGAFCLELEDLDNGGVRPCVHVEVTAGDLGDRELAGRLSSRISRHLVAASADFAAAVAEDPATAEIAVRLHAPLAGPFAANASRIKRRYIVR